MSISAAGGVSTAIQAKLMNQSGKQQEAVVNKLIDSTAASSKASSNSALMSGKGGLVSLSA
jgi:hypothetical protein